MLSKSAVIERRRQRRLLIAGLLATDACSLAIAFGLTGVLRASLDEVLPVVTLGLLDRHVAVSLLAIPVLICFFWRLGCYEVENCLSGTSDYTHIAHGATYGVVLALALSYFSGNEPLVSRSWLVLAWAMSIGCVSLGRFAARRVVRRLRRRGLLHTRVVIVGASRFGVMLAQQFRASESEGIDVIGFLDEYLPFGEELLPRIAVIGRPSDLVDGTRDTDVDEYVLVPQAMPYERLEEVTRLMVSRDGPVLRMAVNSRDLLTHGVLVTERSHVPLITLQRARLSGLDVVLKRALDISGALVGLIVMAPMLAWSMVGSSLTGKRPLLTPQLIFARGGGTTRLWLLAEGVNEQLPVRGSPALLAVLAGRLSLVGPRPIACKSGERPPRGLWVTSLPPGLTGPWRLSGPNASIQDQALQDLAYVRNYSIWEDLRILLQSTRPGALLGRWQAGAPIVAARAEDLDLADRSPAWISELFHDTQTTTQGERLSL
jgi:lipopolysaccharide/colanic/teichoic acid biosynthesis glycosyltransferase